MSIKIFDSELNVLEVLWKEGDLTAGQIAVVLKEQIDWSRNTTYTVIGKLVDKVAIERYGTNFSCKALVTKKQIQQFETEELVHKLFGGSAKYFLDEFLSNNPDLAQSENIQNQNDNTQLVYVEKDNAPPKISTKRFDGEVNRLKQLLQATKERWRL